MFSFSESLKVVNEATAIAHNLKPGQKLCTTCDTKIKQGDYKKESSSEDEF